MERKPAAEREASRVYTRLRSRSAARPDVRAPMEHCDHLLTPCHKVLARVGPTIKPEGTSHGGIGDARSGPLVKLGTVLARMCWRRDYAVPVLRLVGVRACASLRKER